MNNIDSPTTDTQDLVRLSYFIEMGKEIVKAKSIEETLQKIMERIGEIFSPMHWSVLLKDPETNELTFTLVVGKNASKLQGLKIPAGEGIAGWIVKTGRPLIVEDVSSDDRFSSRVDRFTGFKTESIIGVPLKTDNKVFGVVELVNKLDGNPFTPFDLKLLTAIADFAALSIERAYYLNALRKLADTDPLTGVRNRRAFDRVFAEQILLCEESCQPFSLLMIDIDDFKKINDLHGHFAGDEVLKHLGRILLENVRRTDTVFRFGGDEFIVLMPQTVKQQAAEARKRILEHIDRLNEKGADTKFSASIGLRSMEVKDDRDIPEHLDTDLYQEKQKKIFPDIDDLASNLQEMLRMERSRKS